MGAFASDFDLVVKGGVVASGGGCARADVGVREGRIAAIAEDLGAGRATLDAAARVVTPGGVDTHCHMDQPAFAPDCPDDFESATRAALQGGTTTVAPFAMFPGGGDLAEGTRRYRGRAEAGSLADFAIHLHIATADAATLGAIAPLVAEGHGTIKIFTTYEGYRLDDAGILAAMAAAQAAGALTMLHAEDDAAIAHLTRARLAAGDTGPDALARARPIAVERAALHRLGLYAEITGAPVIALHVSGAEALDEIVRARRRGVRFHAETCPHYLLFGERDLARPEGRGAEFIVMPCLRTAHDRERLWRALASGEIDLVSSDHSPSHRLAAVRAAAAGTPFTELPGGCPGIQLRAPLLFAHGVMGGRLSPGRFAELIAERPAALFGLAGKGRLAIGADADLVLWDPEREVTVDRAMMHDGVDFTPYAGQRLRGWPAAVVSRGEIVVRDGVLAAQPGRGRFIPMRPCAGDWPPGAAPQ